jgi:hypothetical protein
MSSSGDIVFDENSLSIIDSWIDKKGDDDTQISKHSSKKQADSLPSTGKAGLGFKGKIEKSKQDALAVRLEKSKQKKRKVEAADDGPSVEDDSDGELHGMVEKMPLSKGGSYSKGSSGFSKTVGQKGSVKSLAEQPVNTAATAIKATSTTYPSMPKPQAATKTLDLATSKKDGSENIGSEYKRKRTKTRSKQKNIRRDNRPDDKKPAHLQAAKEGSEEYMGRPLTDETKKILGVL